MAKEYIEREAVVMGVLGLTIVDPMVAQYADAVLRQIQQVPAADVVEVVHAKWEYHGGDDDDELYGFCTNCHHGNMTEDDIERLKPRYCPNCGARMDGE